MNKGAYVGVEISAERIRIAREWTSVDRLDRFCPQWIVAFDNSLPYIPDGVFDYVWAQSVLTHMPENEIRVLLPAIRRVLKPGGSMLFNFTLSPDGITRRTSVKDYRYPAALMIDFCNSFGFRVEILDDWQDDLPQDSRALHNMMLKLTKPDA
jgi:ubiquinone/menaquinone biosynthesis C-methylase UbiE